MYQYANGYSCAMSREKDHIVLQFRQNSRPLKPMARSTVPK